MKIITWNCNMAFRNKAHHILMQEQDILIVPECEHPDKLLFKTDTKRPTDTLWFGTNFNKGLAVFSYSNLRFRVLEEHCEDFKMIIPISVTGGKFEFNLFAIWAYNPDDHDGHYIEQVWKAIRHYEKLLSVKPTLLVGDFNSNTIWDRKHRESNHSNVVKYLEEKNIYSSYHLFHNQIQGKEQHPTLYMYRHEDKPYHIDYCFMSNDLIEKLQAVEIGDYNYWILHSDHVPLIVTLS